MERYARSTEVIPAAQPVAMPREDKAGFIEAFTTKLKPGREKTVGGYIGDFLTDVVPGARPAKEAVQAGMELWSPEVRQMRESIDRLREINPQAAAEIEYKSGFGQKKTTFQNSVRIGASAVDAVVSYLLTRGMAGRGGVAKIEGTVLGKMGKFGEIAMKNKALGISTTGAAYGALYGFLSGLEEEGDFAEAASRIPSYSLGGAVLPTALVGALSGAKMASKIAGKAAGAVGKAVSPVIPEMVKKPFRLSTYLNHVPLTVQKAALLGKTAFKDKRLGEYGPETARRFTAAHNEKNAALRPYVDDLYRLGFIEPENNPIGRAFADRVERSIKNPIFGKPVIENRARFRPTPETREFRFSVRDIMERKGIYKDQKMVDQALESDPTLKETVEYMKGIFHDKGLAADEQGIVPEIVENYFPHTTPEVPLFSGNRALKRSWEKLQSATTDAEREAIYQANSPVVDDMIEYAVREGTFKTKLEGFKNYYDAMDIAFGTNRVPKEENAFLNWMVENGRAASVEDAFTKYAQTVKNMHGSFTPRASALDYQRKEPLPWSDPDPSRVLLNYIDRGAERMAYAKQFGADDEFFKEAVKALGDNGDRYEDLVRLLTKQTTSRAHLADQRFYSLVRGMETLHLFASAPVNLITMLNHPLEQNFKAFFHGLRSLNSKDTFRRSVKAGVAVSDIMRQARPYEFMSDNAVNRVLKASGFSTTEMLNRVVGLASTEDYVKERRNAFLGKVVNDDDLSATVGSKLARAKEGEKLALEAGFARQQELADEYNKLLPGSNPLVAGKRKAVEARLEKLPGAREKALNKLAAKRDSLERRLLDDADELTAGETADLKEQISTLRSEIQAADGIKVGPMVDEGIPDFDEADLQMALEEVTQIKREKMQGVIDKLTEKFDEKRAAGVTNDVPQPEKVAPKGPTDPRQKIASRLSELRALDDEIAKTNENFDKVERIYKDYLDSYEYGKQKIATEMPDTQEYAKLVEEGKAGAGSVADPMAEKQLQALGIDTEKLRATGGYLSQDEVLNAAMKHIEWSQGGDNPLDYPLYANTPGGKVAYQFKNLVIHQAEVVGKAIVRDLISKDTRRASAALRTMMIVGVVYPLGQGAMRDLRDVITLKKTPEEVFRKRSDLASYWTQDLGWASAAGFFTDFLRSAQQGKAEGIFLPPSVNDAWDYVEALGAMTRDFDKGLSKARYEVLNQTGIGQVLNNVLSK